MAVKILSVDTAKAERQNVKELGTFIYGGKEYTVEKNIVNGEMEVLELEKPIGEMITTADGQQAMLRKVVLDVELGREAVPVLYKPIYDTLQDRNFPEVFDAKWAQWGTVVFLEHFEGMEVRFGKLAAEQGPIARLRTFAAGFEYTEDMVEYNQTFNMEILNRAMGEAYNALLNHLHFAPILDYDYQATNQTPASDEYDDEAYAMGPAQARIMNIRQTLIDAVKASREAKRPGSILLINSAREQDILEAMQARTIDATPYPAVTGISQVIMYDGWDITVGEKAYNYAGVDPAKAYLIRPKQSMKELIKHDLLVDSAKSDLSRLVEEQIVGRARRGVFAAIDESVEEITLPV